MNWENNEEFQEVFTEIRKELYKDDFFSQMKIEDVDVFLSYLKEHLQTAQDSDILSDILRLALDDYSQHEVDVALDELSEKGLIQMVLRDDGKLAYQATEAGMGVNDLINFGSVQIENQKNEIMGVKYSNEIFKVTGVDDSIKFVDHGDNFEIVVIPAGKQHNGEEFIQFYHTIFTDYNEGGPNGDYKLVDEIDLFDMLNTNYNQY
jgi:hypothetical protein